jgi:hypothetical protein
MHSTPGSHPRRLRPHREVGQACSCNSSGNAPRARHTGTLPYRSLHTAVVGPAIVPRASPAKRPAGSPMLSEGARWSTDRTLSSPRREPEGTSFFARSLEAMTSRAQKIGLHCGVFRWATRSTNSQMRLTSCQWHKGQPVVPSPSAMALFSVQNNTLSSRVHGKQPKVVRSPGNHRTKSENATSCCQKVHEFTQSNPTCEQPHVRVHKIYVTRSHGSL